MKARSKSAKNRAPRNRKVRRKPINTAVLPVAVNAPAHGRTASIPVAVTNGPSGKKLVPIAVRRSSGEVVIPAEVSRRGSKARRRVALHIDVKKQTKPLKRQASNDVHRLAMGPAPRLPRRDPITNAIVSATWIEQNVVTLAAQIGMTTLDLLATWSRFLLNRGVRVAKATEQGRVGEAVRALKPPRPLIEADVRFPAMREPNEFRIAA